MIPAIVLTGSVLLLLGHCTIFNVIKSTYVFLAVTQQNVCSATS